MPKSKRVRVSTSPFLSSLSSSLMAEPVPVIWIVLVLFTSWSYFAETLGDYSAEKRTRASKDTLIDTIRECVGKYHSLWVLQPENMRNKTLKELRAKYRDSRYYLIPHFSFYFSFHPSYSASSLGKIN